MRPLLLAMLALVATPALAKEPKPATPLFASDTPIHVRIQGPMSDLAEKRGNVPLPGILTLPDTGATFAVALSPRGITRREKDICAFPPLRVDFTQKPAAGSLFDHQKRLKLVTHCKTSSDFQQKVLLEYAAYRMYNLLTPLSFRARLASIDYVDKDGRPYTSRFGFFIEDIDDVAARNGMVKAVTPDRIPVGQLEPRGAARFALFNYMISNLDWSMRAGPAGEGCCHNGRLLAASSGPGMQVIPVPYDFDFSGLVDAPYASPPAELKVRSVRQRLYRGYCMHSNEAKAAAADMAARRGEILGVLSSTPGLTAASQAKAAAYLDGFFKDLAAGTVLTKCVG